eukprot:sb/3463816/
MTQTVEVDPPPQIPEKRTSNEEPPSSKTMRYDRQLRLWGEEGQSLLESASICLLNGTTLGCEILKNLILPGIGEVTIVDNNTVTLTDIQSNFFLAPRDLSKPRGESVARYLSLLNPESTIKTITSPCPEFIQNNLGALKNYSLFIVCNLHYREYQDLAQLAWDTNTPLVVADCLGMYSVVRLVVKEHCVIESKPDTPLPDLRLDKPYTELIEFYQHIELETLTSTEHAHVPFVVILLKCLDQWKADHGGEIPSNYKEKKEFKKLINSLRRKPEEENFTEACNMVNKCVTSPSNPLTDLFSDPLSTPSRTSTIFWLTVAGIKQFYTVRGVLPISGVISDMTADTESFIALQSLYQYKAESDAKEVAGYVNGFTASLNLPLVPWEFVRKMTKNCRFLRVIRTSPVDTKFPVDEENDLITIPLLMKCVREFERQHSRCPGDTDSNLVGDEEQLSTLLGTLTKGDVQEIQGMFVKDFVRFGGTEVPSVAAFTGGIAAHECIKLLTKQYVPVDNCFVYNAATQTTAVFKI